MRKLLKFSALPAAALALSACITAGAQSLEGVPAETYVVDKAHAFLSAHISHNGLSDYTVDFPDFDASLVFDPADPTAASLSMTVNMASIATHYPGAPTKSQEDWETEITTDGKYFNAGDFPEATFVSTSIEQTGEFSGLVSGDMTFLGVTKPMAFDVTFNGAMKSPFKNNRQLLGFDAEGVMKRSDFGMTHLIQFGISDEVRITFSGEFEEPAPAE